MIEENWEKEWHKFFGENIRVIQYKKTFAEEGKSVVDFISSLLEAERVEAYKKGRVDEAIDHVKEDMDAYQAGIRRAIDPVRVGMLRQWLNEDRITEPKKMVTNQDILDWLLPTALDAELHKGAN